MTLQTTAGQNWIRLALMGLLVACRHAENAHMAPASSGAREVLAAVNLDSICVQECPVIVVDTLVRSTDKLSVVRPLRAPVAFALRRSDLTALGRSDRTLLLGARLQGDPARDTVEIGLYIVKQQSPLHEDRMFGVTVWPPGLSVRVLFVALVKRQDQWAVKQAGVYMEP